MMDFIYQYTALEQNLLSLNWERGGTGGIVPEAKIKSHLFSFPSQLGKLLRQQSGSVGLPLSPTWPHLRWVLFLRFF